MNSSPFHHTKNHTTHKKVKGAPDYDDAAYWDTKFITGQDVGEWLNEGDLLIERAIAELETQFPLIVANENVVKEGRSATPRALHLGPGISAIGSKLCEAFEKRGWKGSGIVFDWAANEKTKNRTQRMSCTGFKQIYAPGKMYRNDFCPSPHSMCYSTKALATPSRLQCHAYSIIRQKRAKK
ncbi:uncharacterized protein BHQ10_008620 [Talaromyces amestolkiae]|uniref:Uncharacterized protein n=1 Tax=Talaromyces amestolkiae TaxID=1196081 RepID=A0A364L9X8_TALAM|nr:uncharacterized protein BHQ10_008620 [Talaromyces amestolkiae]RAO72608.1 hypothetical protein BHQ10_008620 [Talaromyces amestolkiae]